jgi:hypothetical protein
MAMVTWPRVDAECPVDTADCTSDRTAGNSAKGTAGGIACPRAAPHSSNNALSMNRDRRGEQSRNRGYSEFFLHRHFSVLSVERGLNTGLREKFPRRSEAIIRLAALEPADGGANARPCRSLSFTRDVGLANRSPARTRPCTC